MSSETLSQNDIDRLLGGGSSLASATANNGTSSVADLDVQVYDFRRPHRVSKERLRTLEAMYERLVKTLEAWLIGRVRGQIEMRLQSVEQFSFGEFTLSLPTPCASYIFDIGGTGQQGVIDVGHEFAFFLIDRLFGGSGAATIPNRPLSPVERMTVRLVAERVSALLGEIWQDHVPMDIALAGFESSPEILQIANREDPVLVANVEVAAGHTSSLLLLCLPFSVLDKFFSSGTQRRVNLTATTQAERDKFRQRTEASVRVTRVPLSARLPSFKMSMRELASLQEGSVIATGIPRDSQLTLRIGEQDRFNCAPGRVAKKLAVRVLEPTTPRPSESASDEQDFS